MRDFFEGLKSTDDIMGYLADNKGQTIRAAAAALGILTVLLLVVYRGDGDLELTDTADPLQAEAAEGGRSGAEDADGAGNAAGGTGGTGSGTGAAGNTGADAYGGGTYGTDGVVTAANGMVYVDIGGAVKEPKLAELTAGSRVEDAIRAAGGLTGEADLSSINRAALLNDGEKVYVPKKGEVAFASGDGGDAGAGSSGTGGAANPGGKISINSADIAQLQTITGVGPVTAQKIIDYRTENGRFASIEDLKNISGIGEKTFEKMKNDVTL